MSDGRRLNALPSVRTARLVRQSRECALAEAIGMLRRMAGSLAWTIVTVLDDGPMSTADLADTLARPPKNVRACLQALRASGLVCAAPIDGRTQEWYLHRPGFGQLVEALGLLADTSRACRDLRLPGEGLSPAAAKAANRGGAHDGPV